MENQLPTELGAGPQHSETRHLLSSSWCQFVSIWYVIKGGCRVTVMTVDNCGGYAPMLYILWGQLLPLPPGSAAYGIHRNFLRWMNLARWSALMK